MSKITSVKLWKDVGFTDGCVEVPSYDECGTVLTDPDYTFTDGYYPSKDDLFSVLKLKTDEAAGKSFTNLQKCSYLCLDLQYQNTQTDTADVTYYGWIDSVKLVSDNTGYGMVEIRWHVDLWRTYYTTAEFGSGMVMRKPYDSSVAYPMQSISYRYRRVSRYLELIKEYGTQTDEKITSVRWVIIAYTYQNTSGDLTQLKYYSFPVNVTLPGVYTYYLMRPSSTATEFREYYSMAFADVMNGLFDEYLGLEPSAIVGVWISPVCPADILMIDISGEHPRYRIGGIAIVHQASTSTNFAYFEIDGEDIIKPNKKIGNLWFENWTDRTGQSVYTKEGIQTSETSQYSVCDERGEIVGTLPAQMSATNFEYFISVGSDGCYVMLRFYDHTVDGSDQSDLFPMEGMEMRIAMQTVPITENSWSEYAYTYARQYDIDSRLNAIEINHLKGFTSAIEGTTSGAVGGAMAGAGYGAIAGGLIGGVGSLISNETVYNIDKGNADTLQKMEDMNQALQTENLLMTGSAPDWVVAGLNIRIVELQVDEYSSDLFTRQKELNGMEVSEPTSDCTSLLGEGATGPVQISQLVVKGPIPVEAKQYIKRRIEQGVRLKTL